jgi:hypothetical protein
MLESNQRPLRCERSALTAALIARLLFPSEKQKAWISPGLVGDAGIEPATSSVSGKRAPSAPAAQIIERDLKRWARESNSPSRLCRPLPNRLANPPNSSSLLKDPRAANGTRTRALDLGKVALYQLSYGRMFTRHCLEAQSRTIHLSVSNASPRIQKWNIVQITMAYRRVVFRLIAITPLAISSVNCHRMP